MAGELSFFELGVADTDRARRFYGELFGWEFSEGPSEEQGGYVIKTPNIEGGVHGGDEGAWPYVFFRVNDIDAAIARIRELGGDIDRELDTDADSHQQYGRFVFCLDDQGSHFGLHEPPSSG